MESGDASMTQARRPWYILDLTVFGGFVLTYAGFFGIVFLADYVDGLSGGMRGLTGLAISFGLGVVVLLWLLVLPVWMVVRWPRRIPNRRKLAPLCLAVSIGLMVWIALPFVGPWPARYERFSRGFSQYMRANLDLPAVRDWLNGLDPGVCSGESIDLYRLPDLKSHWPDTVSWPTAITRFDPHYVQLMKTDAGQPSIRLTWGGALGHWGVEIGPASMKIPRTREPQGEKFGPPGREYVVYDTGEYRLPLAAGAYVWYEIQ